MNDDQQPTANDPLQQQDNPTNPAAGQSVLPQDEPTPGVPPTEAPTPPAPEAPQPDAGTGAPGSYGTGVPAGGQEGSQEGGQPEDGSTPQQQ